VPQSEGTRGTAALSNSWDVEGPFLDCMQVVASREVYAWFKRGVP